MIRALLCLLPLTLCACASGGEYPSLARRSAERITGTAEAVAPAPTPAPAPLPASAALSARLAQLVEQARSAHRRFGAQRAATERLVAAAGGTAVASENWSVASVALAELETARSSAMVALGALDQIYAAEAVAAAETGNTAGAAAAEAAHQQVAGWVAEEDAVVARLRARL